MKEKAGGSESIPAGFFGLAHGVRKGLTFLFDGDIMMISK